MQRLLVDSHAHLDFPDFREDLDAVLDRARGAGVGFVLSVGTDLPSSRRNLQLARRFDPVSASIGFHPHNARDATAGALADLESLARDGAVALGEIGLDFFRDRSPRDVQRKVFRAQLQLASRLELPVILHSRNAWQETFAILSDEPRPKGGVVHCFSEGPDAAAQALSLGLSLSFAGPLTYPKARLARTTAASVPPGRILLETDSPFLTPHPHRGRRNEPAYVLEVAKAQAELHGMTLEDLAAVTTANCRALFGMGPPIPPSRIAYGIRDSLYLNLTNRCTARCIFCARTRHPHVAGHNLELPAEPTVAEVMAALREARPERYREVVFCGYGEPTLRLDVVLAVGKALKAQGHAVRLNTNGTANLIHGRDVTGELAAVVDEISVSLNAQDAATYNRICRPEMEERTWPGLLDFIERIRKRVTGVTCSIVEGVEGVDAEACRNLAERLGVKFRKRFFQPKASQS
ncbi:MAG: TatD family hydrolase [Planctomycetota bacterium]